MPNQVLNSLKGSYLSISSSSLCIFYLILFKRTFSIQFIANHPRLWNLLFYLLSAVSLRCSRSYPTFSAVRLFLSICLLFITESSLSLCMLFLSNTIGHAANCHPPIYAILLKISWHWHLQTHLFISISKYYGNLDISKYFNTIAMVVYIFKLRILLQSHDCDWQQDFILL